MVLLDSPTSANHQEMCLAASVFTNAKESIVVSVDKNHPNTLVTEFSMKSVAQYKVVDEIAREFKRHETAYEDLRVSFSK